MLRCARFAVASFVFAHAAPATADPPVVLDRLVATVDAHRIYRSDVAQRARPYVAALPKAEQADPKRITQVLHDITEQMIDERLVARECEKSHLDVEEHEIEATLDQVAKANKVDRARLLAEAAKQGMAAADYRAEIRRQIIDAKWTMYNVRTRVQAPIVGTEEERAEATTKLVQEERKKLLAQLRAAAFVEVKW